MGDETSSMFRHGINRKYKTSVKKLIKSQDQSLTIYSRAPSWYYLTLDSKCLTTPYRI